MFPAPHRNGMDGMDSQVRPLSHSPYLQHVPVPPIIHQLHPLPLVHDVQPLFSPTSPTPPDSTTANAAHSFSFSHTHDSPHSDQQLRQQQQQQRHRQRQQQQPASDEEQQQPSSSSAGLMSPSDHISSRATHMIISPLSRVQSLSGTGDGDGEDGKRGAESDSKDADGSGGDRRRRGGFPLPPTVLDDRTLYAESTRHATITSAHLTHSDSHNNIIITTATRYINILQAEPEDPGTGSFMLSTSSPYYYALPENPYASHIMLESSLLPEAIVNTTIRFGICSKRSPAYFSLFFFASFVAWIAAVFFALSEGMVMGVEGKHFVDAVMDVVVQPFLFLSLYTIARTFITALPISPRALTDPAPTRSPKLSRHATTGEKLRHYRTKLWLWLGELPGRLWLPTSYLYAYLPIYAICTLAFIQLALVTQLNGTTKDSSGLDHWTLASVWLHDGLQCLALLSLTWLFRHSQPNQTINAKKEERLREAIALAPAQLMPRGGKLEVTADGAEEQKSAGIAGDSQVALTNSSLSPTSASAAPPFLVAMDWQRGSRSSLAAPLLVEQDDDPSDEAALQKQQGRASSPAFSPSSIPFLLVRALPSTFLRLWQLWIVRLLLLILFLITPLLPKSGVPIDGWAEEFPLVGNVQIGGLVLVILIFLYVDRHRHIPFLYCDESYLLLLTIMNCMLGALLSSLYLSLLQQVYGARTECNPDDPYCILFKGDEAGLFLAQTGTATLYYVSMLLFGWLWRAVTLNAVPREHALICLFPLQLLEELFSDLCLFEVQALHLSFFGILVLRAVFSCIRDFDFLFPICQFLAAKRHERELVHLRQAEMAQVQADRRIRAQQPTVALSTPAPSLPSDLSPQLPPSEHREGSNVPLDSEENTNGCCWCMDLSDSGEELPHGSNSSSTTSRAAAPPLCPLPFLALCVVFIFPCSPSSLLFSPSLAQ